MSDKTIVQKLFIKPGFKFLLVNPTDGYIVKMGELPPGATLLSDSTCLVDAIQVFVENRAELEAQLPRLKELMAPNGMIWVTYHKGTSKVKTDIHRDSINAYAKSLGLEGVAIISIDEDWSALRLKSI
jgi:agmatine/peptidylarginine deiminase